MRARVPAIVCLVLGAVLFAGGLGTRRWGSLSTGVAEVGLLDTTCAVGTNDCHAGWHGHTAPTVIEGKQFARLGELAFVVGILAVLAAIGAAHPRLARALGPPATLLALAAVAAATAFVVTEPFSQFGIYWRPGPAWWMWVSGAALIAAGARLGPAETARAWTAWLPLALAAPALAITANSTGWWRGSTNESEPSAPQIAIGPAWAEECDEGMRCEQERLGDFAMTELDDYGRVNAPQADLMGSITDGVFPDRPSARLRAPAIIAGRAIAVTSAVAAALAAALALAAAARRRARVLAWATLGALAAVFVAVLAFEGTSPDAAMRRLADVHRASGLPIALAAIGLVMVPAIKLARARAPSEPVAEPAPAIVPIVVAGSAPVVAEIPPCPHCRAPMLWVSKRKTWLCTVCKARDSVTA